MRLTADNFHTARDNAGLKEKMSKLSVSYTLADSHTEKNLAVIVTENGQDGLPVGYRIHPFEARADTEPDIFIDMRMVTPETLVLIAVDFLNRLNGGPDRCRETSVEITKLEEALLWAKARESAKAHAGGPMEPTPKR